MTTQVVFNIDKNLKERAMKKARKEGIPFASVLKMATKSYVDGDFAVQVVKAEKFNTKTRREIRQALKDIEEGKNLSPAFSTAKEAMAYLNTL